MKVISAAVGMYDIMEQQVSVVESLEKKRARFPDMAAIYLLEPSSASIGRLLAEYADKTKVLYGKEVFVYFLGPVPKKLMNELKQCKQLLKRLKGMAEVNTNFLVKEDRAFTLDMQDPFASLYRSNSAEIVAAEKLVTVCATLNEYPYIRYNQSSRTCSSLASIFKLKMDKFVGSNPSWWYHGSGNCPYSGVEKDRSTVLLLDRSSDCLTPLMHDFTYQAMVNDLLNIYGDKITYKAESQSNPQIKEDKDVLLNDKDKLWVEMRGEHIAKVIEVLSGRISDVVNSSTSNVNRNKKGSNMSLAQLASALKELPEYREVMSKLSQHMNIAHECMDMLKRDNLLDLGDVEQTLATGKDDEGNNVNISETIRRCEAAMLNIRDPKDRLRLILIATISQGGLSNSDKDRLLRAAQLGRKEMQTLESIAQIGIPTVNNKSGRGSTESKKGFLGSLRNRSGSVDSYDEDNEYTSMRYAPPLRKLMKDLVGNQLSLDDYPSVIPMPPMMTSSVGGLASSARRRTSKIDTGSSRRGKGGDWGSKRSNGPTHYEGGRSIVFMVGGLSFGELRVIRDVMERESREIIAGGTKFISPGEFIDDLKTLTDF